MQPLEPEDGRDTNNFKFRYSAEKLDRIIAAYQDIFDVADPDACKLLSNYFDFRRERTWSILTSDFTQSREQIKKRLYDFDLNYRELRTRIQEHIEEISVCDMGKELLDYAKTSGQGFSIGICPKTDDLLGRTYESEKECVVIVLARDWYPIVTEDKTIFPFPPLTGESVFERRGMNYNKYGKYFYKELLDSSIVLYMNLYPDYREPGAAPRGNYEREKLVGYAEYFNEVCKLVVRKRKISGIISWGRDVYCRLFEYLTDQDQEKYSGLGLKRAVMQHRGVGMMMKAQINYYPFIHPSCMGLFNSHVKWYETAIDRILDTIQNR